LDVAIAHPTKSACSWWDVRLFGMDFSPLPAAVSAAAETESDPRTTIPISAIIGARSIVAVTAAVVWPIVAKAIVTMMMVTVAVIPMVAATRANVGRLWAYAGGSFCRHIVVRSVRCGSAKQRGCSNGECNR
jgi:hypothetical protein